MDLNKKLEQWEKYYNLHTSYGDYASYEVLKAFGSPQSIVGSPQSAVGSLKNAKYNEIRHYQDINIELRYN